MRNQYPPPSPEEIEIVKKCEQLGVKVNYIYDFVQNRKKYVVNEKIAELFANELRKAHDKSLLSILMSAGALSAFREIMLPPIVTILRREGIKHLGQVAANELVRIAQKQDSELLASLLLDKNVGGTRTLLMRTYARIAKKTAIPVLKRLVDDPETYIYALHHLSILGDITIDHHLKKLSENPDGEFRKIARDALKRVEKNKLKLQNK
jgi:hypothetical protein